MRSVHHTGPLGNLQWGLGAAGILLVPQVDAVRQTFSGSLALLAATGETPVNLRIQVTSPGGTTKAGLDAMEAGKFREIVASALIAAKKRGEELGKK